MNWWELRTRGRFMRDVDLLGNAVMIAIIAFVLGLIIGGENGR